MLRTLWLMLRILAVICGFAAFGISLVVWRALPAKPTAGGEPVKIDSLSLQIDILSLTLAAVGIGLAVVGVFGYQAIKEAAEAKAERKSDEIATRQWRNI